MSQPFDTAWSRRDVLKFGAAALAASAFAPSLVRALEHGSAEYGGLPMGIQSYTLRSMSLDAALAAMKKDLNLDEIELYTGHIKGMSPKQVNEKLHAHGVKCVSVGVVPFGKDDDANRKQFELGKALGCKNLSCDPENDAKCWESVGKLCDEYNMTVAIHPHGRGARWQKIDQIHEAIKDVNPKIGLNDETGWLIDAGEDPLRALDVFKDRVYALHLKDFKYEGDKREDVPAGDGKLDVEALVKKLLEMKFDGVIAVEYEGGDPIPAVQKSLARIKDAVKKAKGA
jgi:sugar phosphate isomerase/epimerase